MVEARTGRPKIKQKRNVFIKSFAQFYFVVLLRRYDRTLQETRRKISTQFFSIVLQQQKKIAFRRKNWVKEMHRVNELFSHNLIYFIQYNTKKKLT